MPNIDGLVWLGHLMHVSEDISASHTRINLSIAALTPFLDSIYIVTLIFTRNIIISVNTAMLPSVKHKMREQEYKANILLSDSPS